MKTIAQQLNIKEFPFEIKDFNGNEIYWETAHRFWFKKEYDCNGNRIYHENSNRFWIKNEFDSSNNLIYCESSNGYWFKREYDSSNNEIYYEDSYGEITDKRPKPVELTMDEIALKLGINVNLLKIKK